MWVQYSGGHFVKYWGGGGARGHAPWKIFKIWTPKMHLKHSENTFCKKLRFRNTVLINGIKLQCFNQWYYMSVICVICYKIFTVYQNYRGAQPPPPPPPSVCHWYSIYLSNFVPIFHI